MNMHRYIFRDNDRTTIRMCLLFRASECRIHRISLSRWPLFRSSRRTSHNLKKLKSRNYKLNVKIFIFFAKNFIGCSPGKTFHVSEKWHPKLYDALVSIPDISPGDTVWWHADLVSYLSWYM